MANYVITLNEGKSMEFKYKLFLEALKASLTNENVDWDFKIPMEVWREIFCLAESHKVVPMILDAVHNCPAARYVNEDFWSELKRRSVSLMVFQIQKTSDFLKIYQNLQAHNLHPLVVKGLVCRQLYRNPDFRISSDEDLLVSEDSFQDAVDVLQEYGMRMLNEESLLEEDDEAGFISSDNISYIELHKLLFSKESEAYGDLNRYFTDTFQRSITIEIQGVKIETMNYEDHLFYLICHAFKHFLHSGFGIRQVCDIVLMANAYGAQIDWHKMLEQCKEVRAEKFSAALFKIGKNYLNFDEEKATYPKEWREIEVDEKALLLELLGSGIYGGSSMSRKHSSNMTLEAVAAQNRGKKPGNTVMKTLFPSARNLQGRYHYLKKRPYLLPVAWGERILKYQREITHMEDNQAMEAVRIGNRRIELLKQYGILDKS